MVCSHCELAYPSGTTSCSRCGRALSSPDLDATIVFDGSQTAAAAAKLAPTPVAAPGVITPPPVAESQIRTAVHFSGAFSFTLQPGTDFGPRYRIESLLGEGGMGSVYKATDKELGRTVALKLVRPEFVANAAAMARFRQELLLASKISHKNILRIHDLGDAGGMKFITMAYVEGPDLGKLMEDERLAPERALNFAKQLCNALDAAHAEEVVHRDLKPNNILIDKADNLFVMDFGLAKSIESEATMMTRTGQILGTPRYMAPEQVEAKPVDHRADLYAFGLILYEMATGELPFRADSAMQLMYQRVTQKPKDIKLVNPDVPDYLARIIMRCLEKEPGARYQSAKEILQDLETEHAPDSIAIVTAPRPKRVSWKYVAIGLSAVGLILVGVVLSPSLSKRNAAPPAVTKSSAAGKYIAIVPFRVTGDQGRKYLADGLVESLSAKLLGLSNLYVASPSVVEKVNPDDSVDKIGRQLGVKLVMRGMLDVSGDRVKVQTTLDDASTKQRIWSNDFSGLRQDLLTIEDQIYTKLVSALDVKPSNEELARTASHATENIDAYELYLKARNARGARDVKSVNASMNLFDQAIKKDPGFALAYTGLADASVRMYDLTKDNSWTDRALASAEQAQRLNDNLPEVHVSLGAVYQTIGKTAEAQAELKRAVELAPNSDDAYRRLALAYLSGGRNAEAIQTAQKATTINPYYFVNFNYLGSAYLQNGEYEKASAAFRRVTELEPENAAGYLNLGMAYYRQGKVSESIPVLKTAVQRQPTFAAYSNLGVAYFYLGNYNEAVQMFEKAVEINPNQQLAVGNLADAYRWSGQAEKSKVTYDRAISLAFKAIQVNPRDAKTLGSLSMYYAKKGDSARSLEYIRRARGIDSNDNSLMYKEGLIYALAGRKADSLVSLREAFQKRYSVEEAQHDPELARLREDPEFKKILQQFGGAAGR